MRIQPAELASPPAGLIARLRAALTDPSDPIAVVLPTSGSTGIPKQVLLPSAALCAAAEASHARLGGPGQWLAALPLQHIGGLAVLIRSIIAGTDPIVLPLGQGFSPDQFRQAATELQLRPGPHYTSLVPTQLSRLLAAGAAGVLSRFSAVLIGGAQATPSLISQAKTSGVNVINSYGMTETCGGVVYDGHPLQGVRVRISSDQRIQLCGSTLAQGYTDPQATGFSESDGVRWFTSNDLGRLTQGRLELFGRADDLLISGGVKVVPTQVEARIAQLPGVRECLVVGVPDPDWGQRIEALIVGELPSKEQINAAIRPELGRAAVPKTLHQVAELPSRGPGKPDRAAASVLAAQRRTPQNPVS